MIALRIVFFSLFVGCFSVALAEKPQIPTQVEPLNNSLQVMHVVNKMVALNHPLLSHLSLAKAKGQMQLQDSQTSSVYQLYALRVQDDPAIYYLLSSLDPCLKPPCERHVVAVIKVDKSKLSLLFDGSR